MLRRQFLAAAPLVMTEGARLATSVYEIGDGSPKEPGEVDPFGPADQAVTPTEFYTALLRPHFPYEKDQAVAIARAMAASAKGWTHIGVWDHKSPSPTKSLVGRSPKTGRIGFLPD